MYAGSQCTTIRCSWLCKCFPEDQHGFVVYRCGRAIRLAWTVFYDDYTVICKQRLSHGTGIAAEALSDLFGMWYAKEGSKAVSFFESCQDFGILGKAGQSS